MIAKDFAGLNSDNSLTPLLSIKCLRLFHVPLGSKEAFVLAIMLHLRGMNYLLCLIKNKH